MINKDKPIKKHEKAFIHIRYETFGWGLLSYILFHLLKYFFKKAKNYAPNLSGNCAPHILALAKQAITLNKVWQGIDISISLFGFVYFVIHTIESFVRKDERTNETCLLWITALLTFFIGMGLLLWLFTNDLVMTITPPLILALIIFIIAPV